MICPSSSKKQCEETILASEVKETAGFFIEIQNGTASV